MKIVQVPFERMNVNMLVIVTKCVMYTCFTQTLVNLTASSCFLFQTL